LKGYIEIEKELCKECHLCISACKKGLIASTSEINSKGYHPVEFQKSEECTGCTLCAIVCPEVAIEVYRE
jgi:2-oxoglutarate ferredoxin oxidoreductase subunit delta